MKHTNRHKILLTILISICALTSPVKAQESYLRYFTQFNAIVADGDNAPFWLTANRQGLTSTEMNSNYGRYGLEYGGKFKNSDFSYKCTGDIAVSRNSNADFFVQQLFGEVSWRWLTLSIGSKERFSETRIHADQFAGTGIAGNRKNDES